jgi:flagellar motor switch protein FliN
MSDGSLSQDEIDALLSGIDPGTGGGQAAGSSSALGEAEKKAFMAIVEDGLETQGQNLFTITGQSTSFQKSVLDVVNRDGMIQSIPEEVLAVTADMVGGVPGAHLFIMGKDLALRIASLANKEEGLSELDDMAISAVQEAISTLTGSEVTLFSDKTGNKSFQASPAAGAFVPKAMVKVPEGDFARITYQVQIGEAKPERMIEIFSIGFVRDIVLATGGGKPETAGFEKAAGAQNQQPAFAQQGGGFPQQGGGYQQQGGGYQQQGGGYQQQGGYGQQAQGMGGYGMPQQMQMGGFGGMGYQQQQYPQNPVMGMNPPNVQSVQFPNLQVQGMGQEQGNIGLIMDVYMEMTVELGRTKKLIKEILGMGEGTIIELDKLAGEPVDILVNHKLIAKGEVVVIDENFGVRVTEIVSPMERMAEMG